MSSKQEIKDLRSYTLYPKSLVELDGIPFMARCSISGCLPCNWVIRNEVSRFDWKDRSICASILPNRSPPARS